MSREIAVESTNKSNDAVSERMFSKVSRGQTALIGNYSATWMIDANINSAETEWLGMLHRAAPTLLKARTGFGIGRRPFTVTSAAGTA